MQADNLLLIFTVIAIVLGVSAAIVSFAAAVRADMSNTPMSKTFAGARFGLMVKIVFAALLLIGVTPSTRTLAAMYIVPAIANSKAIQKDFPELYDLAIGKLKEQLAPAVEKKP